MQHESVILHHPPSAFILQNSVISYLSGISFSAETVLFTMNNQRSRRIGDAEWESHKAMIEELYVRQDKPLGETMNILATEYQFTARLFPRPFTLTTVPKSAKQLANIASVKRSTKHDSTKNGGFVNTPKWTTGSVSRRFSKSEKEKEKRRRFFSTTISWIPLV